MQSLQIENLFFVTIFLKQYNRTHFIFGMDLDDIQNTLLELYPEAIQVIIATASDYYQLLQNSNEHDTSVYTIVSYDEQQNIVFEQFDGAQKNSQYENNIVTFKSNYLEIEKLNQIIQDIFLGNITDYLISDKILHKLNN